MGKLITSPGIAKKVSKNSDAIANIATVISGTTNNSGHAISAGEYFIANGSKYKASATIDTNATWSDKSTSVSDHDLINALNSKIANLIKTTQGTMTLEQADGDNGYKQVTVDTNLNGKTIIGMTCVTGSVANAAGLQTSLVFQGGDISYINYYRKNIISSSPITFTVTISYI